MNWRCQRVRIRQILRHVLCTRRVLCTKLCKYRRCDVGNAKREKLTSRLSQLSITNEKVLK